jgi:hypothetical protein
MGQCIFCGEKAGLFKKEHAECRQKHVDGEKAVWALALKGTEEPESLMSRAVEECTGRAVEKWTTSEG